MDVKGSVDSVKVYKSWGTTVKVDLRENGCVYVTQTCREWRLVWGASPWYC